MKRVAVTGATGFVGRHLVAALARAGWQVRVLMRRDPVVAEWRGIAPQVIAGCASTRTPVGPRLR